MVIELGKTYRTRNGREVRLYAIESSGQWPIHGAVLQDGVWQGVNWKEGGFGSNLSVGPLDLVEVKPRIQKVYWVNIYPTGAVIGYESKESAAAFTEKQVIARVKIELDFKEGEGLDEVEQNS